MKLVLVSTLVASAAAFSPAAQFGRTTALNQHIGSGGMADTRNPDAYQDEDPRKSISAAPSFEEYLKQRAGGGGAAPAAAAPAAAPAAAAPAAAAPAAAEGGFTYGEYDDKLWDQVSKKDVYNKWDPNSPRSTRNFNPFETFKGNSPDASGIYPGENRYKDPLRGDANFQTMMAEKADAEERAANPKPGSAPGCPGCKN
ncbi:hypothetical protein ACHAWO_000697 [Cyclotella atomus]|uniref:Uncharacterized protein n=1 Tax=Cyclotella atomus TaxID=382360 RepID=A0ABD3QYU4_9STRA